MKILRTLVAAVVGVCALTQAGNAAQMALKMEGDPGSFFAAPNHPSLGKDLGSNITIEAWVNPAVTIEENGLEMMIINKEDQYEMAMVAETFQVALRPAKVGDADGSWTYHDSTFILPINTWTHVAMTYDGTFIRTFANGKFMEKYEWAAPDGGKGTIASADGSSAGKSTLKIGRRGRGDAERHSIFNGMIDEVRISKVERYTEAGYAVPAKAFEPDANTVVLYHFDEVVASGADVETVKDRFALAGATDDNGDGELDPPTQVAGGIVRDAGPLGNHGAFTGAKATLVAVTNGPFKDTP